MALPEGIVPIQKPPAIAPLCNKRSSFDSAFRLVPSLLLMHALHIRGALWISLLRRE
jgi:hypothetical protein